jgi:hypothetical protein
MDSGSKVAGVKPLSRRKKNLRWKPEEGKNTGTLQKRGADHLPQAVIFWAAVFLVRGYLGIFRNFGFLIRQSPSFSGVTIFVLLRRRFQHHQSRRFLHHLGTAFSSRCTASSCCADASRIRAFSVLRSFLLEIWLTRWLGAL